MKKIGVVYLFFLILIMSYIFCKYIYTDISIDKIHGSDKGYCHFSVSGDNGMEALYDEITKNGFDIRVIEGDTLDEEKYYIYCNMDIEHIQSFEPGMYFYYDTLDKDKFVERCLSDGFFSNVSDDILNKISNDYQISFTKDDDIKLDGDIEAIVNSFKIYLVIIFISNIVVMVSLAVSNEGKTAVKKILGFSRLKTIKEILLKLMTVQICCDIISLLCVLVYCIIFNKVHAYIFVLLFGYELVINIINILIVLVAGLLIKRNGEYILNALKKKLYSKSINEIFYCMKLIFALATVYIFSVLSSNYELFSKSDEEISKKSNLDNIIICRGYYEDNLNNRINSYGMDNICKDIKKIYIEQKNVYIKETSIFDVYENDRALNSLGLSRSTLTDNYEYNYCEISYNYIDKLNIMDLDNKLLTRDNFKDYQYLLVPEKYKYKEQEIKEYYINVFDKKINSDFYNNLITEKKDVELKIIYIKNGQEYMLKDGSDTCIKDLIILVENNQYGSYYYYEKLQNGEMQFVNYSKEEVNDILKQINMDEVFIPETLLYNEYVQKANIEMDLKAYFMFFILISVIMVFGIYVSNNIDILFNRKKYALMFAFGHGYKKVVKTKILENCIMVMIGYFISVDKYVLLLFAGLLFIDILLFSLLLKRIITANAVEIIKGRD